MRKRGVNPPPPSLKSATDLKGKRAKKSDFLVKIFQKVTKNAFFGLLFQNVACGTESLANTGSFNCFGRAQESILST